MDEVRFSGRSGNVRGMGMSHENCTHPRTPAGRAWCRKQGGPAVTTGNTPTPGMVAARESAKTPGATVDTTPTRKRASRASQAPRSRRIAAVHDMADVPHVFSSIIKWAWDHGADVRTGDPYNDREQNIKVKTDNGTATLVWKSANPNGITAVWFRGSNTSVQFRTTVNDAIRLLSE